MCFLFVCTLHVHLHACAISFLRDWTISRCALSSDIHLALEFLIDAASYLTVRAPCDWIRRIACNIQQPRICQCRSRVRRADVSTKTPRRSPLKYHRTAEPASADPSSAEPGATCDDRSESVQCRMQRLVWLGLKDPRTTSIVVWTYCALAISSSSRFLAASHCCAARSAVLFSTSTSLCDMHSVAAAVDAKPPWHRKPQSKTPNACALGLFAYPDL